MKGLEYPKVTRCEAVMALPQDETLEGPRWYVEVVLEMDQVFNVGPGGCLIPPPQAKSQRHATTNISCCCASQICALKFTGSLVTVTHSNGITMQGPNLSSFWIYSGLQDNASAHWLCLLGTYVTQKSKRLKNNDHRTCHWLRVKTVRRCSRL